MSNSIILFTLNGCSHCSSLKKRLDLSNIQYQDIEISQNQKIWDQVVKQTGHNVLPTIFVKNSTTDVGPVFVPGRDYQNEDEIFEIIKSYVNSID